MRRFLIALLCAALVVAVAIVPAQGMPGFPAHVAKKKCKKKPAAAAKKK